MDTKRTRLAFKVFTGAIQPDLCKLKSDMTRKYVWRAIRRTHQRPAAHTAATSATYCGSWYLYCHACSYCYRCYLLLLPLLLLLRDYDYDYCYYWHYHYCHCSCFKQGRGIHPGNCMAQEEPKRKSTQTAQILPLIPAFYSPC